ncbi:MAG: transglutaminase-like domain-containing protein [Alphaproteobacteria bacterium]
MTSSIVTDPVTDPIALSVGCELRFHPRGDGVIVLQIEAARLPAQIIRQERLRVSAGNAGPLIAAESWVAPDGNRMIRVAPPHGGFPSELSIVYAAEVEPAVLSHDPATVDETPLADLPLAAQTYLLPSRYCQSDKLHRLAAQEFGGLAPGHGRVTAICNWIYEKLEYQRGSSDAHTTVHDTLVSRVGVCRDFAHLGIALCRALGIPARFVSAYAAGLQPPDFHAVFEAYLAGRWYLFDPTRQASLDRIARIGIGRDAADVSFATIYGNIIPAKPAVKARAENAHGDAARAPLTLRAVSLSEV